MFDSILLVFSSGLVLVLLLSHLLIEVAKRSGLTLDDPHREGRRIHRQPTPRIGGLALLPGFLIALAIALPAEYWQNQQIQGFFVGAILIALLGIIDDIRSINNRIKLLVQIAVISFVVVEFEIFIRFVNNPLTGGILQFSPLLSALISILWLLGTTNTMNFIDGIDGLATSVTASFALVVLIVAVMFNQFELAVILGGLLGCCLGFLPANWRVFWRGQWHGARTFLGDGGAMFLGFCIGTLSILSGAKVATTLLVLGLPILDILNTFFVRVRRGQSPFTADNEHLHYRLIRRGLSTSETVFLIAGISLGFGLLALANNTTLKVISLGLLAAVSQGIILWSMRE